MKLEVIVTCEHASYQCPPWLPIPMRVRKSHRGWDAGAIVIAQALSDAFAWPLHRGLYTRLAMDLNRSLDHEKVWSTYSRALPQTRRNFLERSYHQYRRAVEEQISHAINSEARVLHLSIHSFTPAWQGEKRKTGVGILYDPTRALEKIWAGVLRRALSPDFSPVHFNKPYKGTDDGLTTYLRTRFKASRYAGIELEINQKYLSRNPQRAAEKIVEALSRVETR